MLTKLNILQIAALMGLKNIIITVGWISAQFSNLCLL